LTRQIVENHSSFSQLSENEAYHREIGREATAQHALQGPLPGAYHREIGREATGAVLLLIAGRLAYHREIGREATGFVVPPIDG
jgi:hypothetical protein